MFSSKRTLAPFIVSVAMLFAFSGCQSDAGKGEITTTAPEGQNEKISYSIGYDIGKNFSDRGIDTLSLQQVMHGIHDGMEKQKPALTDSQMTALMREYQKAVMAKEKKRRAQEAQTNKQKAEAFLKKNKQKEGVRTTASGLQYKILEKGSGPSPTSGDTVRVHYRGKLLSGKVFDSSYKRGQPAEFPVNGVIKGWTEALKMMKEGAKWKLFIPPKLGYGKRGTPRGPIGPNEVLIFEVKLLEVNPS